MEQKQRMLPIQRAMIPELHVVMNDQTYYLVLVA